MSAEKNAYYTNQHVVLVNKDDYIRSVEYLFSDKTQFQVSV